MNVNELSRLILTVRSVDTNGAVVSPTTARYRLDDLTTRNELIAWTSLTPATEMTITIPAASNAIINSSHKREKKIVTVETDQGTAAAHVEEYQYWVKNLQFAG